MKWILLLLFLIPVSNAYGEIVCDKHPIYCQIIKNRTDKNGKIRINMTYAYKLSNLIHKAAVRNNVPSNLYTAILMQESHYSLKAKGCHKGLRHLSKIELQWKCMSGEAKIDIVNGKPVCGAESELIEDRVCADFGMSQVHYVTARGYKLDLSKLTTDLEYSINAGAKVLGDFKKRYEKREYYWWTRYNARSTVKRNIYKTLVERYL